MTDNLNDYVALTADWRKTLRQNNTRTYIVIFLFILIYMGLGLLIDVYVVSLKYPDASLEKILIALLTLRIFPLATCVMLIIASLSLVISYIFYDKLMLLGTNYKEITSTTTTSSAEQQLYNVVEEMKIAASLNYMPKVYVIDADYMNAFASGYSEKSAMVAITRGLMVKLNREELAAVMAHELSHIRHLDIKLTLTASLLSNLTLMVLDIFFYNIIYSRRSSRERERNGLMFAIIILRYLLPIINLLLILYLSRTRELMADAGSVQLIRSNEPLANALLKIQNDYQQHQDTYKVAYDNTPHENVRREAYFYDPATAGLITAASFNDLFSTHPSLEVRLRALGFQKKNNT